jgi:hypothetical protein
MSTTYPSSALITGIDDNDAKYLARYSLAGNYTMRKLSFAEDKLPALSGITHKFSESMPDTYLAGLWRGDLVRGLLWKSFLDGKMSRPVSYRAPSWSWAALDGLVLWDENHVGCDEYFKIIPAETVPSEDDRMGKLRGGRVVISGKLDTSVKLPGNSDIIALVIGNAST